jgi:hypothetical protein
MVEYSERTSLVISLPITADANLLAEHEIGYWNATFQDLG